MLTLSDTLLYLTIDSTTRLAPQLNSPACLARLAQLLHFAVGTKRGSGRTYTNKGTG